MTHMTAPKHEVLGRLCSALGNKTDFVFRAYPGSKVGNLIDAADPGAARCVGLSQPSGRRMPADADSSTQIGALGLGSKALSNCMASRNVQALMSQYW